ncbi:MnhB domain-containing protein [Halopseudomonas sp.]|uniref:MnhB domain-containing protein n=1 Tax=Halopseudomonas sp. TaxID=2901191 RepID=UPI0035616361
MPVELIFDVILVLLLLGLAGAALHIRGLYTAIVLFIVFGLLLAITWARLGAVDLALAEAAIGAGLIGVMLLAALARSEAEPHVRSGRLLLAASGLAALLALALLGRAVWPLAADTAALPALVKLQMDNSGVSHPVTAVLLNFRAWDTLLELIVLLLALLGVRQLGRSEMLLPAAWPLLRTWSKLLAPLTIVIGGYLLWRGSAAPGGAFQAGAVLAAGAVMLNLAGLLPRIRWQNWLMRALILGGITVFALVAAATHWLGAGWLDYPASWSKPLIVLIEVAATLSIATSLTLLVIGESEQPSP